MVQIAMNARDDSAVGRFWAEALGWSVSSEEPCVTNVEPAGFEYPAPVAVCIDVIAVPEPKTVKNRVHLDLATTSAAHQADLVARLHDLGADPELARRLAGSLVGSWQPARSRAAATWVSAWVSTPPATARVSTMVNVIPFLGLRDGTHR